MSKARVYNNFIGGEWVAAAGGDTFEDRNPADDRDVVGRFPKSGPEDVRAAVAAARDAFPAWRSTPAPRRAEILFAVGAAIAARKEDLARDLTREMGKVLVEARGDVQEAVDMAYLMGGEGRRMHGVTTPSELPNKFQMSVRQPLGVAACITPWNFPMAIPAWKMLAALVCGNTVVLKPASDTPLMSLRFIEIMEQCGMPPGVVNLVTGSGSAVGNPLIEHPDVKAVSFTGSTATGRQVNEACAPSFKRCHLEMGGKNAILVMEDADLDLAVDGALWGGFGTTGQRCTAASRCIVHEKVVRKFTEAFAARAKSLRVGSGLDPKTQVGPLINRKQLENTLSYIEIGKKDGARLMCGGHRLDKGPLAHGHFAAPTLFADVAPEMRIAREEIFGPVVSVLACKNLDDGMRIANSVEYGLSGAIYTADVHRAFRAMRDSETGIFYVNASTIGAEVHLPFGGTKNTGNGHREAGQAVLDFFSEWKSIYVDFSGKLQRAQIDT